MFHCEVTEKFSFGNNGHTEIIDFEKTEEDFGRVVRLRIKFFET